MNVFRHPSVVASVGAAGVLAVATAGADVPTWLWAAWAVLAAVAAAQVVREARA